MWRFFIKKLFFLFLSLFIVATITFVLLQVVPGDPFAQEQAVPEEIMKSLHKHYGLDKPWYVQYWKYIKGVATLNLGPSFKYEARSVNEIICEGFPVSLILGIEALLIALPLGLTFGTLSAIYRSKWQDQLLMALSVLGISIPSFLMASFLQYILGMKLSILPIARWGSFAQTIMPAIALAALPTAFIARLTRSNMIEVLTQDYVLTARAKGLSPFQVIFKHVLKNSILPVVTYLGPLSTSILTGSFIIEKIFGIPGLGGWFVMSITNRDYTVIMGVTIFFSAILLVSSFLVEVLYRIIDPRLRNRYE